MTVYASTSVRVLCVCVFLCASECVCVGEVNAYVHRIESGEHKLIFPHAERSRYQGLLYQASTEKMAHDILILLSALHMPLMARVLVSSIC
jgi:hypothetical protein